MIERIEREIISSCVSALENDEFLERNNRIDLIIRYYPKLVYDLDSPLYETVNLIFGSDDPDNYRFYNKELLSIPPEYIQSGYGYNQSVNYFNFWNIPLVNIYSANLELYYEALMYYDGRKLDSLSNYVDGRSVDTLAQYNKYERSDVEIAMIRVRQRHLEAIFLLI